MSRSVLVTGGNRGIGAAIATAFVEGGDKVAVTYRSGEPPEGVFGVRCDVTDTASVEAAVDEVRSQQGPVEVLVANAGIARDALFLGMAEQEFADVIDTNLMGSVRAVKAVVTDMVRARWGRIILVGSTTAFWGGAGVTNYASSKSALVGLARSLAWELGPRKITVNVVYPGLIETEMISSMSAKSREHVLANTPLKRVGTPQEVATAVRFLADDGAGYITGALVPVSGGNGMGH
ncbi:SDR family oxidoreductase [Actinoalloteichus hymeniacidonis]|uniref:3-oxoacyl-(Acyl-carrier-protein) reductase n=1 Tax=Actinoalloteichus hymeniacidonis TaxID=340345 RepID=A0AAC9HU28_9PSEU|nr:SDR family oxidoreductase [Actinoalloteichus hymeniacidonis]AOS65599.1 3-oxoacyl-(acyl-carrier-protein) reductase [Actinoalloteichus hymeniacidonis]MBB5906311.1 3-oxoacyl-[acyl-carrier protein] reductase [Actinoalloteichus hymeniacidonis]